MSKEGLQVTPALVMAIIREGIESGTLRSFSVSFREGFGAMVDFQARYFPPDSFPTDYRVEGPKEPESMFYRPTDYGKRAAQEGANGEPQGGPAEKPDGWVRGAIIERGVATSAGSVLVRYELLNDGRRVGDEWFFLSRAMAIVNGQPQQTTRTDVTPIPGDTVKESFRIVAPGNGGVYIALPVDPFGPGARFELISPDDSDWRLSGILTPVTDRIPKSMSGWKEFFDVYQSGLSFLTEEDSFHTNGSDFFASEDEEFIDDLPI